MSSDIEKDPKRLELLVQVAKLYYIYDMSQNDIAKKIGLSRSYISKLLTEARSIGIVKIEINDPISSETFYERKLREYYHLNRVIVIPKKTTGTKTLQLGEVAGPYMGSLLQSGDTVGMSWGETVYHCVMHLPQRDDLQNITTLQLCGGISNTKRNIFVSEISQLMAQKVGSTAYILPVPAIVGSRELKENLMTEPAMQEVLHRFEEANLLLLTVGNWGMQSPVARAGYLSEEEVNALTQKGAVGDICTHIINGNGELCDTELDARTVAVPLEKIRNAKERIFVAEGAGKAAGIIAALNGGIPTVLITNEDTAEVIQAMKPEIFE